MGLGELFSFDLSNAFSSANKPPPPVAAAAPPRPPREAPRPRPPRPREAPRPRPRLEPRPAAGDGVSSKGAFFFCFFVGLGELFSFDLSNALSSANKPPPPVAAAAPPRPPRAAPRPRPRPPRPREAPRPREVPPRPRADAVTAAGDGSSSKGAFFLLFFVGLGELFNLDLSNAFSSANKPPPVAATVEAPPRPPRDAPRPRPREAPRPRDTPRPRPPRPREAPRPRAAPPRPRPLGPGAWAGAGGVEGEAGVVGDGGVVVDDGGVAGESGVVATGEDFAGPAGLGTGSGKSRLVATPVSATPSARPSTLPGSASPALALATACDDADLGVTGTDTAVAASDGGTSFGGVEPRGAAEEAEGGDTASSGTRACSASFGGSLRVAVEDAADAKAGVGTAVVATTAVGAMSGASVDTSTASSDATATARSFSAGFFSLTPSGAPVAAPVGGFGLGAVEPAACSALDVGLVSAAASASVLAPASVLTPASVLAPVAAAIPVSGVDSASVLEADVASVSASGSDSAFASASTPASTPVLVPVSGTDSTLGGVELADCVLVPG